MPKLAVVQFACESDPAKNRARAGAAVRRAARENAAIALLPELFERPYFCKTQRPDFLRFAQSADENPAVQEMRQLAAELNIVIAASFFERAQNAFFNSLAMIDAGGEVAGIYRKSHIPDGPGYQEKFYFSPGDTGFRVFQTRAGAIGAAICWDQWFPEAARAMALAGADLLLYPTAIGSEPHLADADTKDHWQTAMRGHAAANLIPLAAANRIGREEQEDAFGNKVGIAFYGSSFIAGARGEMLARAGRGDDEIIYADLDFQADRRARAEWGIFRDRRPDLYRALLTLDGGNRP